MLRIKGTMKEKGLEEEGEKKIPPEGAVSEEEKSFIEEEIKTERVLYPFTAIVGQEKMKKALILNAINPDIGGVLIRGQKGTGKSIGVRGIAELLPEIEVVKGCKFNCDPRDTKMMCWECKKRLRYNKLEIEKKKVCVVDLPLNATEDRLVGTLDMQKALKTRERAFEPGILAEVNRGILYIDEINLLDDYLVDVLLDSAAMGVNTVEREGISVTHPAKFIIVGSMNPEEGELRPQLLDRIALQAEVKGLKDEEERLEIVKRVHEFTSDPVKFRAKYEASQRKLAEQIKQAKQLLLRVHVPDKLLKAIVKTCIAFDVDGHRADYIIERTGRTYAAYQNRTEVTKEDVAEAAELALPHRMRKQPLEDREFNVQMLHELIEDYARI